MNATQLFEQQRKLKNDPNGLRVPYILQFPEKYHNLMLKLGTSRMIESFEMRNTGNGYQLKIWLREGERPNLVVMQRLKRLFSGVENTRFPASFENQPILIQIPR